MIDFAPEGNPPCEASTDLLDVLTEKLGVKRVNADFN